jgi:hypothetical protein
VKYLVSRTRHQGDDVTTKIQLSILFLVLCTAAACTHTEDGPSSADPSLSERAEPLAARGPRYWESFAAQTPLRTPLFADRVDRGEQALMAGTIQFADVTGDGFDDVCGWDPDQVWTLVCTTDRDTPPDDDVAETNSGRGLEFGTALLEIEIGWLTAYLRTDAPIRWANIDGDRRDDMCMQLDFGILCAASTESYEPRLWLRQMGSSQGWAADQYASTIELVDVSGDGLADVCGRGSLGVYCATSNGSDFTQLTLVDRSFSDGNGWNQRRYYGSLRYADVDDDGHLDLCGRGATGIYCARWNASTRTFRPATRWTATFADADGWYRPEYGDTIHFVDINRDGAADVCGRGADGVYCGLSVPQARRFERANVLDAPYFSDARVYNRRARYSTLTVADVNDDGFADVCARGALGVYCALNLRRVVSPGFAPARLWIESFGDNEGFSADASYYGTVQTARVAGADASLKFCGRTHRGIACSNR